MFLKKNNKSKMVLISLPYKEDKDLYTLSVTRTGKSNQDGDKIIFKKSKVILEIIGSHLFISTSVEGHKEQLERETDSLCVRVLKGNIEDLQVDDSYEYEQK